MFIEDLARYEIHRVMNAHGYTNVFDASKSTVFDIQLDGVSTGLFQVHRSVAAQFVAHIGRPRARPYRAHGDEWYMYDLGSTLIGRGLDLGTIHTMRHLVERSLVREDANVLVPRLRQAEKTAISQSMRASGRIK